MMKMSFVASIALLLMIGGCGFGHCPTTSDIITFHSFGHFDFDDEGADSTAREIVDDCHWHVFHNNNGGLGQTLQIANQDESIVFVWAFNNFSAYRVTKGWTGKTDRGIKLGDTLDTFQAAYPEFNFQDSNTLIFENSTVFVQARFEDGLLSSIEVDTLNCSCGVSF